MYITQDVATGTVIDQFDTYEKAEKAIVKYEREDRHNKEYEPNFYEIKERGLG